MIQVLTDESPDERVASYIFHIGIDKKPTGNDVWIRDAGKPTTNHLFLFEKTEVPERYRT